jgi:arylsulfatase
MANTPFRRHKTWVHEGGIATPLIVHWPAGIKSRGELRHTPGHVIDVVPTILELAGAERPAAFIAPGTLPPGRSLVPLLRKDGKVKRDALWWLHEGNRALRVGDWKLVAAGTNAPWELYDLSRDRSETRNMANRRPGKLRELSKLWEHLTDEHAGLAREDRPAASTR